MNTLSRTLTARFFATPNEYDALRRYWSTLVNSPHKHEVRAEHHLLYLVLCGKDWRAAFAPIANTSKLENGAFYGWGLFKALAKLHSPYYEEALLAPFGGVVAAAMLREARAFVPLVSPYQYEVAAFTAGIYPIDAYLMPDVAPVERS